jgi:site-specific recombinase XerC
MRAQIGAYYHEGKKTGMINRVNWKLVEAYLLYKKEVDQLSKSSLRLEESRLRHLLEWAGSQAFEKAPSVRPTLPEYMLTARMNGQDGLLSPVYVRKVIRTAYNFFKWLVTHHRGYGAINQAWLDTVKSPRMTIEYAEHEAVTLDEIRAMAQAPVTTLREKRARAAAVFWFLSGIRIGAFVTLPLMAVDLDNLAVKQWPKLGVHTKFSKHATTYLLDIPELLEVVKAWDKEIRAVLPNNSFWFAPISPDTGDLDPNITRVGDTRNSRARKDLQEWLDKVGLPYHSSHKFRHDHAVYALKNAKDIPALKAVSQNLMHANISITDGVYGILSQMDVREQITRLCLGETANKTTEEMLTLIIQLLEKHAS